MRLVCRRYIWLLTDCCQDYIKAITKFSPLTTHQFIGNRCHSNTTVTAQQTHRNKLSWQHKVQSIALHHTTKPPNNHNKPIIISDFS